jgi:hypothetical protein
MSFFDSPIDYCPIANKYVLLDQTQKACALEERCGEHGCPLENFFAPATKGETGSKRRAKHKAKAR